MAERQTLIWSINASGADRGAKQFNAAIKSSTRAVVTFERTASSAFEKLKKSTSVDFRTMAREIGRLSNLRVSKTIATDLKRLSDTLRQFKGPTPAKMRNIKAFFEAINRIRLNASTTSSLTALSAAFQNIKPPTPSKTRNLIAFVDAIGKLKVPRNAAAISRALIQIGRSAGLASRALSGLRGSVSGMGFGRFNAGARRATTNLRGLENAFRGSFQAASLFRTALGTLTLGTAVGGIFNASVALQRFRVALGAILPTAEDVESAYNFVIDVSDELGVSLEAGVDRFARFAAALSFSGQTMQTIQEVYRNFATGLSVLGSDAQSVGLVFLALEQVFSKGRVSTEEVRRQLGERLPGAMQLLANALASRGFIDSANQLDDLLRQGAISSEAMILLGRDLADLFEGQLALAAQRADFQLNRLNNTLFLLKASIGDAGFSEALADLFRNLADKLQEPEILAAAERIGQRMGEAITQLEPIIMRLIDNIDLVIDATKIFVGLLALSAARSVFSFALAPVMALTRALGVLTGAAVGATRAVVGLATGFRGLGVAAAVARFGLVGLGIAAAVLAVGILTGVTTDLIDEFKRLQDEGFTTGDMMLATAATFSDAFNIMREGAKDWTDDLFSEAFDFFDSFEIMTAKIRDFFVGAFRFMARIAGEILDELNDKFQKIDFVIDIAAGTVQGVAEAAVQPIVALREAVEGEGEQAAETFFNFFTGRSLIDGVTSRWGDAWDELAEDSAPRFGEAAAEGVDNAFVQMQVGATGMGILWDRNLRTARETREEAERQSAAEIAAARARAIERQEAAALLRSLREPVTREDVLTDPDGAERMSAAQREAARAAEQAAIATDRFQRSLALLQTTQAQGTMTTEEATRAQNLLNNAIANSEDPMARELANLADENILLRLSNGDRAVENNLRQIRTRLISQGIDLLAAENVEMLEQIENQLRLNELLENPDSFNEFLNSVDEASDGIASLANKIRDDLGGALADFIVDGKLSFADMVRSWAKDLIKLSFNKTFGSLFDNLGAALGNVFGGGATAPATAQGAAGGIVPGGGCCEGMVDELGGSFGNLISGLGTNLTNMFGGLFGGLGNLFTSLFGGITSSFSSLFGGLGGTLSSLVGGLGSSLTGILSTMGSSLGSLIGGLGSSLSSIIGGLFSGGGGAGGGIGGLLGIGASLIGGLFKDGGISQAPSQTMAVKASAFRNAPHFQAGGTTSGMGGGPIPAVLHNNEAVIPLKNGAVPVAMAGGGGGSTIVNNINMTVNATDANSFNKKRDHTVRQVARELNRVQKRDLR